MLCTGREGQECQTAQGGAVQALKSLLTLQPLLTLSGRRQTTLHVVGLLPHALLTRRVESARPSSCVINRESRVACVGMLKCHPSLPRLEDATMG